MTHTCKHGSSEKPSNTSTVDDEPSVANRTLLVTSLRFPHMHACRYGNVTYLHACRYGNVPKRPLPHHSDDVDGGDGDDGDGDGGDDEHDDDVYARPG